MAAANTKTNDQDDLPDLHSIGEFAKLGHEVEQLQLGFEQLERSSSLWQHQQIEQLNAIEAVDSLVYKTDNCASVMPRNSAEALVICCGCTTCPFPNCQRRMSSQLILLHYLTDHMGDIEALPPGHALGKGERVTLSFDPKCCHLQENRVLGLIASVETHVHIVVLICKTAASAASDNKQVGRKWAASEANQVYVIWLVTPHEHVPLSASLSLCGRDPAVKASSLVPVRQLSYSPGRFGFEPVGKDYWQLSFGHMQRISNDFRDELHLEIGLSFVL